MSESTIDAKALKQRRKNLINLAICLVIMIGFRFIPPVAEITPAGMQILGVFLGSIYGWVTVDLMFPSILGMIFLGLTDVVTTTEAFAQGWGSQMVVMTIVMLFVTAAIQQLDLTDVIVGWLMNLKFSDGRPYFKIFCFLIACLLISIVSVSVVAAMMFVPLYRSIMEKANLKAGNRLNTVFMVGIAFASLFGDMCLPFKPMALMVFMMANPFLGDNPISMAAYLSVFPFCLVMLILYLAICKLILRIDASPIKDLNFTDGNEIKINKHQKWFLIVMCAMLITMVLPSLLPTSLTITNILNTLNVGGIAIVYLFLFLIIHVDHKPLMDLGKLAKDFSWGMILMMAYFTPVASLLTEESTGINATISSVFGPILGGLPPYVFVIVVGMLTAFLTNFFNNGIVAILFMTLSCMLAGSVPGINLGALCIVIVICSVLAVVLPSACPTNAFLFSHRDITTFKGQALHGLLCCFILCLLTTTVGYILFGLFM